MTEIATTATEDATPEEVTPDQVADEAAVDAPDDGQEPKKSGGVRQKITALEAERDGLSAALAAAHAQAFDGTVQALGLQPALMRAAGLDVADYVREDGTVDTEALTVAADTKRAELGLSRRPLPNPIAGANRGREMPEKRSLGDVLKSVTRPV